jgi:hypothetical protein
LWWRHRVEVPAPLEEVKALALLMEIVAQAPLVEEEAPALLEVLEALLPSRWCRWMRSWCRRRRRRRRRCYRCLALEPLVLLALLGWSLMVEEVPVLLQVPAPPDPLALLTSLGWLPLEAIEVPSTLEILKAGGGQGAGAAYVRLVVEGAAGGNHGAGVFLYSLPSNYK